MYLNFLRLPIQSIIPRQKYFLRERGRGSKKKFGNRKSKNEKIKNEIHELTFKFLLKKERK